MQKRIRAISVPSVILNQKLKSPCSCSVILKPSELVSHFLIHEAFFMDGIGGMLVVRILQIYSPVSSCTIKILSEIRLVGLLNAASLFMRLLIIACCARGIPLICMYGLK